MTPYTHTLWQDSTSVGGAGSTPHPPLSNHLCRYKVSSTISQRVGHLNPAWNEDDSDTDTDVSRHTLVLFFFCQMLDFKLEHMYVNTL